MHWRPPTGLWIAATSRALNCELITGDRDFDHLDGTMIHRRDIDLQSLG
jgi:predicted nucleic acid-binding protein